MDTTLASDYGNRVLALRILDPAMGSGHFLIRACQYLAIQIATNPHTRDPDVERLRGDESLLAYWKRRVVESCLYGVDRNPLAVELAKLALWLETVSVGQPLTFLDHHLRHGDSLLGTTLTALGSLPDAPPLISSAFSQHLSEILATLLATLTEISNTASDTLQHVKHKESLFRRRCEKLRAPLRAVADIWCATFFVEPAARLMMPQYGALLKALKTPAAFLALQAQHPYQDAAAALTANTAVPFHWELEFPEVFFNSAGSRREGGFDAIIGNPPYDVLSDKETGRALDAWKAFYRHVSEYAPSHVGKNNLYKLFLCRAFSLLAAGGRLGFIVPMPILGDEQASGIRQMILNGGAFSGVEAFPQKDDPHKRVFRDAKLSTAIIAVTRTTAEQQRCFRVRVHPADHVEPESPGLLLSTPEIPQYDPQNLTIVSCSQTDWDLATRMMQSGRLRRLGDFCTSYQGEVNETTDGGRGMLSEDPNDGPLVLRGSNVTMYALRPASQGKDFYLLEDKFVAGKDPSSKAFHSRTARVGFQRSSPQNNFRRIIACIVPPGNYCFDTISYIPATESQLDQHLLLALLNSKLLDWYFRLGSTNSKVNEYQFNILPSPEFRHRPSTDDDAIRECAFGIIEQGRWNELPDAIADALRQPPFSIAIANTLSRASYLITEIESHRGDISRSERSALSDQAQPIQDATDEILFRAAGFTPGEWQGIEQRLSSML